MGALIPLSVTTALQKQDKLVDKENSLLTVDRSPEFYKVQLTKQLDLNFKNVFLEKALRTIAQKSNLIISYRTGNIPDKRVTLKKDPISTSRALKKVLRGTRLQYLVSQKGYLVIKDRTRTRKTAVAQQDSVTGTVVDAQSGNPMPGVNILVKGTARGTSTDRNGNYQLAVPSRQDTLIFTYIGYQKKIVPIAGRETINVKLMSSILAGEEVVVVGYTEQSQRNISGAVSKIGTEEISAAKVSTFGESLKGKIAGVNVTSTGEPGEQSRITIRGASFIGENEPLFVVDGMYTQQTPNINPDNIESIQVLKDASAAAQYGTRAANGVIVINTKSGDRGKTNVSFNAYYGVQEIAKKIDMMEVKEWAKVNRRAYKNAGMEPMEGAKPPFKHNTNWQDALFEPGAIQNYNLSISGGSEDATYLISGSYMNEDGTVVGPTFERFSLRINSEIEKGIFTIGESVSLSRTVKNNMIGFPLVDALRMLPTIPVYDSTTTSGFGYGSEKNYTFGTNPVGLQKMTENKNYNNQLLGNLYAKLDLTDYLQYKLKLGIQYDAFRNTIFNEKGIIRLNNPLEPANFSDNKDFSSSVLIENLLTFDHSFGSHNIKTVAGFTEQRDVFNHLNAYREEYSDENLRVISAGIANLNNAGHKTKSTLRSYLVRLNYDFDGKYLFTGNFRRDGSSRFGPNNRYGNFASASVGWILSDESFYDNIPVIGSTFDFFKLRASYGELGNQEIGDYQFAGLIQQNIGYVLGDGRIAAGATQMNLANPSIQWQENEQTNIGINLKFLDSKFTFEGNYYVSQSNGLLVRAPLPPSLGSQESPFVNAGSVENTGLEFSLGFNTSGDDYRLNANVNLTTIKNEVLSLGNNDQPLFSGPFGVTRTTVGGPIGAFYVLRTDGLFQSEQEVDAHGAQPDAQPGDIRYKDLNNDGIINDEDRQVAGSPFPDFEVGLQLNGNYKNFDFSASLRGVYGNKIFNVPKFWTNRMDDNSNYRESLDPWTPDNRDTKTPRAVFGPQGAMNAQPVTDRWLEDGSYLRIQNLEIGYTLPSSLLADMGMKEGSFRVYVSSQNLLTITGYSNWDPEITGTGPLAPGVDDQQTYPNPRTLSVGVDIDL